MNLIERIKATVAPIMEDRFVYDSEEELNVILDNELFPIAFMTLVDSGTITDSIGRFNERITINMYFADLFDETMTAIEREDVFARLKGKALGEWLPRLRNADGVKLVSVNSTQRQDGIRINEYDVILTAYVVNVTLEDTANYGTCG